MYFKLGDNILARVQERAYKEGYAEGYVEGYKEVYTGIDKEKMKNNILENMRRKDLPEEIIRHIFEGDEKADEGKKGEERIENSGDSGKA